MRAPGFRRLSQIGPSVSTYQPSKGGLTKVLTHAHLLQEDA